MLHLWFKDKWRHPVMDYLLWMVFFWKKIRVPSVLQLVSCIATRHFNNIWTSMIVIWDSDKWYINLFPAETETSSNTMAKLFQTEMTRMKVKGRFLWLLESGHCYLKVAIISFSIYLIKICCLNTKKLCFRVWWQRRWRRQWWSWWRKTKKMKNLTYTRMVDNQTSF